MPVSTSADAAKHYGTMQITTASKAKRICMLHDRCIHLITHQDTHFVRRRGFLNQAQNILAQLQAALRSTDEVGQSLFYLYDYCYVLLERASLQDQRYVLQIFTMLRDTFYEQMRKAA